MVTTPPYIYMSILLSLSYKVVMIIWKGQKDGCVDVRRSRSSNHMDSLHFVRQCMVFKLICSWRCLLFVGWRYLCRRSRVTDLIIHPSLSAIHRLTGKLISINLVKNCYVLISWKTLFPQLFIHLTAWYLHPAKSKHLHKQINSKTMHCLTTFI